jgi:hypothetical protein
MASPVLQLKRGALSNLPALKAGEPAFTTDNFDLYIGLDETLANNKFFGSHRFWTKGSSTTGSGINLVEGTDNGTHFITLKSPNSLSGIVTYTMPGTDGSNNQVLATDGSGNLSFIDAVATLGIAGDTGTDTIALLTDTFTFAGTANEIETAVTDNQVQIGLPDSVSISNALTVGSGINVTSGIVTTTSDLVVGGGTTITGYLYVGGTSEFIGQATFRGGTINLGDSDTDDVVVGGEFASNLVPTTDDTYSLGSASKQWKDLYVNGTADIDSLTISGVSTFTGAIDANGGADISGGETTLSSATVSDLTDNRVIIAGTSGALEDDANFTYDGTDLSVNSAKITDLTSGRVLLAGTSGAVEDSGNLTFDGSTLTVSGEIVVNSGISTFTGSIDANGGADISGQVILNDTLSVTGVSTFTGAIDANGGANISGGETILSSATVSDLTNNRVVIAGQTGVLEDDANFTYDGNDLSVNSAKITDLTSGRVLLAGTSGAVEDSGNLTFNGTTLTVTGAAAVDNVSIDGNTVSTSSGGLTLDSTAGTVTVDDNLTVSGNLTVLGSQSIINTETLKVEDSLIEVGLVNSGGSLVAPSSDANIDVGLVFHYYSGSAKKAALYWDDSVGRVVVGSDVSESNSVMTASTYADFEIGSLYVNDCAGSSQVISCTGSERFLNNITIDGGSF